jgi:membrane protein
MVSRVGSTRTANPDSLSTPRVRDAQPVMRRLRRMLSAIRPVVDRIGEHDLFHHAAAMTYYALLSLFPAMLIGVGLLGLLGSPSAVDDVARYLENQGAPAATVGAVRETAHTAVSAHTGSSLAVVIIGMLVALYGASGWLSAAGKGLDAVHGDDGEDDPGFVRRKAVAIAATLGLIGLALVAVILVFLGGRLAKDALGVIGLGSLAAAWQWLRWPAAFVVAMLAYGLIYATAPSSPRRFRPFTPGAAVGVALWLVISAVFFLYVDRFSGYNATYGVFAGFVVLLVWLWLTSLTVLAGAEIDSELARRASASSGQREDAPGERLVVGAEGGPPGTAGAEPDVRLGGDGEPSAKGAGGEVG